mgnify:CR=1 FL=1
MKVSEAVYSRQSIRAFTDQEVPDSLIQELLEKSSTGSEKIDREIRFVSPGQLLEPMTSEEWDKHKKYF